MLSPVMMLKRPQDIFRRRKSPAAAVMDLPAPIAAPLFIPVPPAAAAESPRQEVVPFSTLTRLHQDANTSSEFWWSNVGRMLSVMLSGAGYDIHSQYSHLLFFMQYVCPVLGPRPSVDGEQQPWRSFMTDDFTPLELSWAWDCTKKETSVRYSIEPIGGNAGTSLDPFNEACWHEMLHSLPTLCGDTDMQLYKKLAHELLIYKATSDEAMDWATVDHASQVFLAFDLERANAVPKAYLMPTMRSAVTGVNKALIVHEAIKSTDALGMGISEAYSMIEDFMASFPEHDRPQVEIIGFDLYKPVKSRVKLYIRSRETTWTAVRHVLSLGGRLEGAEFEAGVAKARELWYLTLGLDEKTHLDSSELQSETHRTAGILYYFDLKPGKAKPESKVYIPARHYGKSDLSVAMGVKTFLEREGMHKQAQQYYSDLMNMFPGHPMGDSLGIHTYISCGLKGDTTKVTAYTNPGPFIHSKMRGN